MVAQWTISDHLSWVQIPTLTENSHIALFHQDSENWKMSTPNVASPQLSPFNVFNCLLTAQGSEPLPPQALGLPVSLSTNLQKDYYAGPWSSALQEWQRINLSVHHDPAILSETFRRSQQFVSFAARFEFFIISRHFEVETFLPELTWGRHSLNNNNNYNHNRNVTQVKIMHAKEPLRNAIEKDETSNICLKHFWFFCVTSEPFNVRWKKLKLYNSQFQKVLTG